MNKFWDEKYQLNYAKLIAPYFDYLANDECFLEHVEEIRIKYWLSTIKKGLYEVPLYLLHQDYWNLNFDTVAQVKLYDENLRDLWKEFHTEIENLSRRYKITKFPNILKQFILTNRFSDVLLAYNLIISWENWEASWSIYMKKKYFENIWIEICRYKKKNDKEGYMGLSSPEIQKKYKSISKIQKINLHQNIVWLLIKKQLWYSLWEEKGILKKIDKTQKSKLNALIKDLVYFINILNSEDQERLQSFNL